MKTGCFYNPRPAPGRCLRDTQSANVDNKCIQTDNGCALKPETITSTQTAIAEQTTSKPTITPTKPQIATLSKPQITVTKPTITVKREKLTNVQPTPENEKFAITGKISGPVSAFSADFKFEDINQKLNLYGDAHFSLTGTCKPCQDFNLSATEILNADAKTCYDISVLLAKTFTEAAQRNEYIDFYIELPFLNKGCVVAETPLRDYYDYISRLHYIFYKCLHKKDCQYVTTRFHYTDSRLQIRENNLECLVNDLDDFKDIFGENPVDNRQKQKYINDIYNLEMYITFVLFDSSIDDMSYMIMENSTSRNSKIEDTDKLMKALFFTGGNTLSGRVEPINLRLFKLYLYSDNLTRDVERLLDLKNLNIDETLKKTLYDLSVSKDLLVYKDGKVMHKIRSQLYALEKEGKSDMAKYIALYFEKKYETRINTEKIMDMWNSVMIVYKGLLSRKISYNNFNLFKKKFIESLDIMRNAVTANAVFLDVYLLARFFRSYPGKNHVPAVKSIIYAGNAHILTYVEFFESLNTHFEKYGEITDSLDANNIVRCVPVHLESFL